MNIRSFILTAVIILLLTGACSSMGQRPGPAQTKALEYQSQVEAIRKIQGKAFVPHNKQDIEKLKSEFDVNEYFTVLKNLTVEPGWRLDYIHTGDIGGDYPIIFAYKGKGKIDIKEIEKKYEDLYGSIQSSKFTDYLDHIRTDGTEDGFFQFVVLRIMGAQFALFWHANYNDAEIVCTKKSIKDILQRNDKPFYHFDWDFKSCAKRIDPAPSVSLEAGKAIVRVVTFTKWGGFIEHKFHVSRQFPHKIINDDKKVLVYYDCGVMY